MEKRTIKRNHKPLIIFILIAQFIFAIFIAAFISNNSLAQQVMEAEIKRNTLNDQILEGASTEPTKFIVSYDKQISTGSPLIFGGAHMPKLSHQDAWNKIKDVGVTIIRRDFLIEHELPNDITLEDYKNNVNDVQNPENWNKDNIDFTNDIYKNAKERKIKIMAIIDFAPPWLTYSGIKFGVPKDWDVYEDLVKKSYKLHAGYIDYIEIWNEPTLPQFLDTSGSELNRQEAYIQIYFHAHKAIKQAQKEINEMKNIPIGGPVGHDPIDTSILEALLQDSRTKDSIDFASYHNYENLAEPSLENYKKVLKKYGKENIPVYLTEWNYSGAEENKLYYRSGDGAIYYTADKFIKFLKMGLGMANYYALHDANRPNNENDDPSFAFYKWDGNQAELLPQAKTWRILSKDMKLGKGESKIYEPESEDKSVNTLGFINVDKEPGIVLVNTSSTPFVANVKFNKIPLKNYADVEVFYASKNNDAKLPEYKSILRIKNGATEFSYYVPAETIMAVKLTEKKDWFDFLIH